MKNNIFTPIFINFSFLFLSISLFGQRDSVEIKFKNDVSSFDHLEAGNIKIPILLKVRGDVSENLKLKILLKNDIPKLEDKSDFQSDSIFIPKELLVSRDTLQEFNLVIKLRKLNSEVNYVFLLELYEGGETTNNTHVVYITSSNIERLIKALDNKDTIPIGSLQLTKRTDIPLYAKRKRSERKFAEKFDSISLFLDKPLGKSKYCDRQFYKKNVLANYRWNLQNLKNISKLSKEISTFQEDIEKAMKDSINSDIKQKEIEKMQKQINDSLLYFVKKHEELKNSEIRFTSIQINTVDVVISEGRLANITVSFDDGEDKGYYVSKGPISLTNFKKKRYYKLYYVGPNRLKENTFIILSSFLNYNPSTSRHFIPSDVEIRFKEENTLSMLYSPANPLTFFDARVYTDAKGLGGQENGLVQTDLNARFIGNTNAVRRSYLTFFQYVNVGLSYSKFDSKFDTLKLSSLQDRLPSELLRINQFANTSIRLETDLLRGSRVHDAYIKLGHLLTHTKVSADTLFKNVFTPSMYLTLGGTLHAGRWIRADFKFPFLASYLMDQPFSGYKKRWDFLIIPEIEFIIQISQNDKDEKNSLSNKPFVFARLRYFDMPWKSGNNFWQIQTGVQVPISNLLKR